jgi:AraC family transcriptional activator of pobA
MSQLFLITKGHARAIADGEAFCLESSNFLYIPDKCVHEFVFQPETEGQVLSFPTSVLISTGPNTSEVLLALSKPFCGRTPDSQLSLCNMLSELAHSNKQFRSQQVVGLAHCVLAMLAEFRRSKSSDEQSQKPDRLFALDRLIEERMADGWTASEFASALSITTGHLSRICRSATGLGAAAYIEERMMEEASRMLAFTRLPVSEIGYRLGYADPSYFSRRFRALRQQSPSQYRAFFTN